MDRKVGSGYGASGVARTGLDEAQPATRQKQSPKPPRPSLIDQLGTRLGLRKASVLSAAGSHARSSVGGLTKTQQEHLDKTFEQLATVIRDTGDGFTAQQTLATALGQLALMDKSEEEQASEGASHLSAAQAAAVAHVMKTQVPALAKANDQPSEIATSLWSALVSRVMKDRGTLVPILDLASELRADGSPQYACLVRALATTLADFFGDRTVPRDESRNAGFQSMNSALEIACSNGNGMNHARTQTVLEVADAMNLTLSESHIGFFEDTLKTLSLPQGTAALMRAQAFMERQRGGGLSGQEPSADRKSGAAATASAGKSRPLPKFQLPEYYVLPRLGASAPPGHSAMLLLDAVAQRFSPGRIKLVWTEIEADLGRDQGHMAPLFERLYAAKPDDAQANAVWLQLQSAFTGSPQATRLGRLVVIWELGRLANAHGWATGDPDRMRSEGTQPTVKGVISRYAALKPLAHAVFKNVAKDGADDVALYLAAGVADSAATGFADWSALGRLLKAATGKHPAMKAASVRASEALELLVPKGAPRDGAAKVMQGFFASIASSQSATVDAEEIGR